jgi:3-hydroxybutyrate dehydrogenase
MTAKTKPRSATRAGSSTAAKPLKGKVAIVTGSTSGIGLGIANVLASAGCNVVLNGFGDAAAIEKTRADLARSNRVKALYHGADMSKPEEIRALVDFCVEKLGTVDIIVNNAGIQHTAPTETFPDEKWNAIMAINLHAPFHMIKAALPYMRKRGWGRIINIASVHGLVASTEKIAYVTAKHGVVGMTKVVALECATSGITANAICPGWVRTPLVEAQIAALAGKKKISIEEATIELLAEKQPSLRFTEVEHLGALTLFLCSEAASNVTGTTQVMDGGWTAR